MAPTIQEEIGDAARGSATEAGRPAMMATKQFALSPIGGGGPGSDYRADTGWRSRLRQVAEQAYHQPESRAYRVLFELTTFLVLISLLMMVLEGVPAIGDGREEVFFYLE